MKNVAIIINITDITYILNGGYTKIKTLIDNFSAGEYAPICELRIQILKEFY